MAWSKLRLADVIDLELQLEADRALAGEALHARDRAIGLAAGREGETRPAQLRAWLDALRAQQPEGVWLGDSLTRGARLLAAVLVVAGLMLGSGTARVLLQFDGVRPVNILPVVGILVLLQVGLLLLVLSSVALSALLPGLAGHLPLVGDLRAVLRGLAGWLASRGRRAGGSRARWVASMHRLRARSRLHAKIELWWMTLVAQAFGIAFNVGAGAVLALLPVVLKYSFCWSTTLSLGPSALHRITALMSWPWSRWLPAAAPSRALIEATQFDIFTRHYAGGPQPASSAWWPFLLACLIGYGLLPRVVLAISATLQLRAAIARMPLDTPDVEAVLRRLSSPRIETRGPAPELPPASEAQRKLVADGVHSAQGACAVVAWRDLPLPRAELEHWLQAQLGWSARDYYRAGGADFEADRSAIQQAATCQLPVVVVAESWEPPDKAVRHFLSTLRRAIGASTQLAVVLVHGAQPEPSLARDSDEQTWSVQLAALEDPYLSVQSMGC